MMQHGLDEMLDYALNLEEWVSLSWIYLQSGKTFRLVEKLLHFSIFKYVYDRLVPCGLLALQLDRRAD